MGPDSDDEPTAAPGPSEEGIDEPVADEDTPDGFERWRRESAIGGIGTGIARGLQAVFAPPAAGRHRGRRTGRATGRRHPGPGDARPRRPDQVRSRWFRRLRPTLPPDPSAPPSVREEPSSPVAEVTGPGPNER